MSADRLGVSGKRLFLLQATALDKVIDHLDSIKPALAGVDSIQTVHDDSLASTAGSVAPGIAPATTREAWRAA